jgi:hypothetical protein
VLAAGGALCAKAAPPRKSVPASASLTKLFGAILVFS